MTNKFKLDKINTYSVNLYLINIFFIRIATYSIQIDFLPGYKGHKMLHFKLKFKFIISYFNVNHFHLKMTDFVNSSSTYSSVNSVNEATFLYTITLFILYKVLPYVISYFCPIAYLVSVINNCLIIYILAKHKQVAKSTSKAIRIYYAVLAFCDINYTSTTIFIYFLGK